MVQTRQGVRSTKNFILEYPETKSAVPDEEQAEKTTHELGSPPNELVIRAIHTRNLYTYDTGRFPVRSRSGNHYVMVAYHYYNIILVSPFKKRKQQHRLSK